MVQAKANSWVEVNLDNIAHNIQVIKKKVGEAKVLAVVKADAYGHGAVRTALSALSAGAKYLGVSLLEEAVELRNADIQAPILIMSLLLNKQLKEAVAHDCTITVGGIEQVIMLQRAAADMGKNAKVHINVDVGMHRYGVSPSQVFEVALAVSKSSHLTLEGIYTHFPKAEDKYLTLRQLQVFLNTVKKVDSEGISIPIKHCANSTATAYLSSTWLDMVRVGTLMFGQCRVTTDLKLKPTWMLKSRVVTVSDVAKGTRIGYGLSYKVKRDSRIAIVPIGFADGISMWPVHRRTSLNDLIKAIAKDILRYFGANMVVEKGIVRGKEAPYVGKVGMQHLALDITEVPGVVEGDEVVLRALQANINARLPKVFYKENREKQTMNE